MAAFEYVALDVNGRRTRGVIAADSARAARRELKDRKLTLLELEEAKAKAEAARVKGGGGALSSADRVVVVRQLAMLIGSGAPVEEALNAVASQSPKPKLRRLLLNVRSDVMEGARFSDALARQGKAFGPLARSMASAGEATGDLAAVMARLADLLDKSQKTRQKITGAVVYPIVLAIVAFFVIAALMVFVVPRVVEQFDTLDAKLPLLTEIVIWVSDAFRNFGLYAALGVALGVIGFTRAMSVEGFRRVVDGLVLKLPGLGGLVRSASAARFARTFGSLLRAQVPAIAALSAAKATVDNRVVRAAVDSIAEAVSAGGGVAQAMKASAAFPPLLVFLAASGERSGELGVMFEKGADYLENELETSTTIALNLLEPMIIVVMGGIVATIVMAIMLPILRLNSLALV